MGKLRFSNDTDYKKQYQWEDGRVTLHSNMSMKDFLQNISITIKHKINHSEVYNYGKIYLLNVIVIGLLDRTVMVSRHSNDAEYKRQLPGGQG